MFMFHLQIGYIFVVLLAGETVATLARRSLAGGQQPGGRPPAVGSGDLLLLRSRAGARRDNEAAPFAGVFLDSNSSLAGPPLAKVATNSQARPRSDAVSLAGCRC